MARYWILLFGLAALLLSTLDLGLSAMGMGRASRPSLGGLRWSWRTLKSPSSP